MRPLAERLAPGFATVTVDWPGFGDRPRPRVDWRPEAYAAFLAHLPGHVIRHHHATVAAGHAAGYVLARAATLPGSMGRLCLEQAARKSGCLHPHEGSEVSMAGSYSTDLRERVLAAVEVGAAPEAAARRFAV